MKTRLNTAWSKLTNVEIIKNGINKDLSKIEFKVLCFISLKPTTRSKIVSSKHFKDVSFSTIKRAVTTLIELELINVGVTDDSRKKLLTIYVGGEIK